MTKKLSDFNGKPTIGDMVKDMLNLFELLAYEGGEIVCTSSLSPHEIAMANAQGRMVVRNDGIGFVWRRKST